MYKLFNTTFKTKAEIQSYCRGLLERTQEGQHLAGEPLGVIIELVGHRGGGKKLIKEIKSIFVRRNLFGTAKGFYILYIDSSIADFSYIKAIRDISLTAEPYKPTADILANFKSAMRFEIRRQISDFKIREFPRVKTCAISGEPLVWAEIHVDHYPVPFDDLLWNFCQERDVRISDVQLIDLAEFYELSDPFLSEDWRRFHVEKAQLRLTTAKANASAAKPATKDWHSLLGDVLLERKAS